MSYHCCQSPTRQLWKGRATAGSCTCKQLCQRKMGSLVSSCLACCLVKLPRHVADPGDICCTANAPSCCSVALSCLETVLQQRSAGGATELIGCADIQQTLDAACAWLLGYTLGIHCCWKLLNLALPPMCDHIQDTASETSCESEQGRCLLRNHFW